MRVTGYRRIEVLLSSADERPHPFSFDGRWLLEPADENWSRARAWSMGWCWGVAEAPDGGLVVYRYHVTRLQAPVLKRYPTAAAALGDGVPEDILGRAQPPGARSA